MLSQLKKNIRTLMDSDRINNKINQLSILNNLSEYSIKKQKLAKKEKYKIAIIIPGLPAHSGGHTSILRLGTYLQLFGNDIYYITYDNSKREDMIKNAQGNLPGYKGEILEKRFLTEGKYDIAISTLWLSCYKLLEIQDNFDYKIYFVQDFEPYFYPVGDEYFLAMNTYKLGYHIISLGEWNKYIIKQNVKTKDTVDTIPFPVEITQYKIIKDFNSKIDEMNKEIGIAVYIKDDPKRAPYIIVSQLKYLYDKMSSEGYKVAIYFFGMNKQINFGVGENLGQLSYYELIDLYKRCHFGIIASLTNISLVNYEMLACGLPVIDYEYGSAPYFFKKNEMIFADFEIDSFYNKIIYYIHNKEKLKSIINNGQNNIIHKSWEKSSREFNKIIQNIYKKRK